MIRTLTASLALAFAVPGHAHHSGCRKLYTPRMAERAIDAAYRGTRTVTRRDRLDLSRYIRCTRVPSARRHLHVLWHAALVAHHDRVDPPLAWQTVIASWYYAAGGPIACSGMSSYAMGVANLSLPCGTRLRICVTSCVDAVVFDRGPYVAGRTLDLSQAVVNATGFTAGVGPVRYALLP